MSLFFSAERVAATLGGTRILRARVRSVADLSRAVRAGLPYGSLTAVVALFPEADRERIERLVVTRTTRLRRQESGKLSQAESERLERIARLTTLAEEVWESEEDALVFLTTPHPLLDGAQPIDLADSDLDTRRVEDLLLKLEYSLPV